MKLSFSTLACPEWTSKEVVERARDYGFDGVEWRIVDGELVTSRLSDSTAESLRDMTLSSGLRTAALDSSLQLAKPHGSECDQMLDEARKLLRLTGLVGAEHLRVFAGDYPKEVPPDVAASWVRTNLTELVDVAREHGVKIALELHNPMSEELSRLPRPKSSEFSMLALNGVPEEYAGIQWDFGNPYLEGEDAAHTWRNVKSRISYCHVKDLKAADGVYSYVPMGEGSLPLHDMIRWLNEASFKGWMSFEWEKKWHPELADAAAVLPGYVEFMRQGVARLEHAHG